MTFDLQGNGGGSVRLHAGRDLGFVGRPDQVAAAAPQHRSDGGGVRRSNPAAGGFDGALPGRFAQTVKAFLNG